MIAEIISEGKTIPFGGRSIILVGDLGKSPSVRDKPMYVGSLASKVLWKTFNIVVTLDTIFHQEGNSPIQVAFRGVLNNIGNANPILEDWDVLM